MHSLLCCSGLCSLRELTFLPPVGRGAGDGAQAACHSQVSRSSPGLSSPSRTEARACKRGCEISGPLAPGTEPSTCLSLLPGAGQFISPRRETEAEWGLGINVSTGVGRLLGLAFRQLYGRDPKESFLSNKTSSFNQILEDLMWKTDERAEAWAGSGGR